MKVAVVGCGAMGSVYAALLSASGNDVLAVTRNADHVNSINAHGLRVEGASGDRVVRIRAFARVPEERVDHVIVAVKASHVADVRSEIGRLLGPTTSVLTIQNGLGSAELIAQALDPDRLAVGIASGFGAVVREPGHVSHSGMQTIQIGAYAGMSSRDVSDLIELWTSAGFSVEEGADIVAMQWEKLICNVAYSAPCALAGLTVGALLDDAELSDLSASAAEEAWRVGLAGGAGITVTDPVAHARAFGRRIRGAKPSMLQDHELRRSSEIDVINGAVQREAEKVGLTAPVNATLTALVKHRERAFR